MTKCIWMILAVVVVLEMGGDVRGQLAINSASANANYNQYFNIPRRNLAQRLGDGEFRGHRVDGQFRGVGRAPAGGNSGHWHSRTRE